MPADDPFANDRRAELEARITALLLGEYEGSVAADLQEAINADPELRALHDRLQKTIGLLDVIAKPAEDLPSNEDKRAAVLARFKEPVPESDATAQTAPLPRKDAAPSRETPAPSVAPWFRKWAQPIGLAACLGGLFVVGVIWFFGSMESPRGTAGYRTAPPGSAVAVLAEIDEETGA